MSNHTTPHSQFGKHHQLQKVYNVSTHPFHRPVHSTVVALTQITHAVIAENNTTKGKPTVPLKPVSIFYQMGHSTWTQPKFLKLLHLSKHSEWIDVMQSCLVSYARIWNLSVLAQIVFKNLKLGRTSSSCFPVTAVGNVDSEVLWKFLKRNKIIPTAQRLILN